MASAAGIVNRAGHAEDAAFRRAMSSSAPDVQRLASAVRDLVFDVFPQTVEVVWPKQGSVGWGIGPRKFSEQFAYLLPFERHVTLGFYHGGDLPDPVGLLPATRGRQVSGGLAMRSTRITRPGRSVSRPCGN